MENSGLELVRNIIVPVAGIAGGWVAGFFRVRDRFMSVENRLTAIENSKLASLDANVKDLKDKLEALRERIEKESRSSISSYASVSVLAEFQKENEDRWREINRTLGKIEGILQSEHR